MRFFRTDKVLKRTPSETVELYRLNVDKRPRTPARCPFYFLDTERTKAVEATSIVALIIILGVAYWMNSSREDKAKISANQMVRDKFMALVNELEVDGISDELVQWLEIKIRIQTGKDGLAAYTEELRALSDEDGKQAAVVQLMLLQQHYLDEQQSNKERMQWNNYVATFRQMNKAQQKHEIERLKKAAEPSSANDSEKINTLELIHLGNDSKITDVMVGGVKLFTLKEK